MSPEQRSEEAAKAARARWEKHGLTDAERAQRKISEIASERLLSAQEKELKARIAWDLSKASLRDAKEMVKTVNRKNK